MGKSYFELRPPSTLRGAVGNDIAKHFQSRQFLGSAVVVCAHPVAMLSVVRKSWQKMQRQVQIDRARTLNAEEVLRYTRRLIQMQQLRFTSSLPDSTPCADVYFVTPDALHVMPPSCYTFYLTTAVNHHRLVAWTQTLLHDSLVVNYDVGVDLRALGLRPKSELERSLLSEWRHVADYLLARGVALPILDGTSAEDPDLNNTLDTLLVHGQEFTELASGFQRQLDITQPISNLPELTQKRISTMLRLAHRVQALIPSNPHLKQIFGGSEIFFLRDRSAEQLAVTMDACA